MNRTHDSSRTSKKQPQSDNLHTENVDIAATEFETPTSHAVPLQPNNVLWLQRNIGNKATQRLISSRQAASTLAIQRYADIPTQAAWITDSTVSALIGDKSRSDDLESIDNQLLAWEGLKAGNDKQAQVAKLYDIRSAIRTWQNKKDSKFVGKTDKSIRQDKIDELVIIVEQKLAETQTAFRIELAPLATEYKQAAIAHDMDLTRAKGTELHSKDIEFFSTTAQAALTTAKGRDMLEWATLFFGSPANAFGAGSLSAAGLKAIPDYSWLTQALADKIIDDFLIPFQTGVGSAQIMWILQHIPFRNELKAKATDAKYQALSDSMPLMRISSDVEGQVASGGVDANNVDQMAQAVFQAFLDDLPISNLIYSTNMGDFKTIDYLLGNADAKIGAPCMTLSSIFTELFKATMPVPPVVLQQGDDRPLLTKQLAGIGNKGILTRETDFYGNVDRYGDERGYDTVNRIFFGDGHIWIEINGKEYDPTLGISGPKGTIVQAVEDFYTREGKQFKSDRFKATRSSATPPGGAKLMFDRTVTIKQRESYQG